ncbi:MAG: hypothetical protein GY938_18580 [Ketobacter sp.]|nr:hypothetical protein [Ketobacter sp.]
MYGQHDSGWLAFYDFFNNVCGLKDETAKLSGMWKIAKSAGWWLPHRNICWVSERHNILKRNEAGQLHNETGPALHYPDGWAIYALNGTTIPADWIEKSPPSPNELLRWGNVEQRRAGCELLGWNNILTELNAKTIDRSNNPEIGALLEVTLPDSGKERFLQVKCGTGRIFAVPVPPNMQTARQANAWTYNIDTSQYNPEVRT